MPRFVIGLDEVGRGDAALVGGKAANLGEAARVAGVHVPAGFCVTTAAFRRALDEGGIRPLVGRLAVAPADALGAVAAAVREAVEATPIPAEVADAVAVALAAGPADAAYAVRSSATAEDLPTASFAGQQDSFLGVVGPPAVLAHVRRCWASAFTDRAVAYRARAGLDHDAVAMGVLVQRMVLPDAAGVLFTADPATGNRRLTVIEATFGLGEALVAGEVAADAFTVRDDRVVARRDGPEREPTDATLTDAQVVALAEIGRRLEAHFGAPQDVEWARVGDALHVLQSRPITTLFPIPAAPDGGNRVYVSVGHQQMMTDAMRPLGLSMWLLTTRAPMVEAGGRLFVDVTTWLASPASRVGLLAGSGRSDPLVRDALEAVVAGEGFLPAPAGEAPAHIFTQPPPLLDADPALVDELVARGEASLAAAEAALAGKVGPALTDAIRADLAELRAFLFDPRSVQVILSAVQATWWLRDHLAEWLDDHEAADVLTRSAPGNPSSAMGLALLDVADVVRERPAVVAFLEGAADDDGFLAGLDAVDGGPAARAAIEAWLARYGARCVGEIDLTRPRWSERPGALLPALLGNVRGQEAGAGARRFARGGEEAAEAERVVLERLRSLPDGEAKAEEARRMIARVRTFVGYREYPKFAWVRRFFLYKRALYAEADRLCAEGALADRDDLGFLRFDEVEALVRSRRADAALVTERKAAFRVHERLVPPRVLTSEGESVAGTYRREGVPDGALVGLGVSAGTVEGRARVVEHVRDAALAPGDVLITTHTDPSWSPVFPTLAGLVTEVGGLMTHGAVVAREYGLPAVVGVLGATRRIRDGQRVRVHGAAGFVELLD